MRNPLRPANRLPPEIIALCVDFLPRTNPKPIVSLTHVCRYWRKTIISSPRNWTLIGSGWKRLAPLCLERSGALAPLTVSVSTLEQDKAFLQLLLPHLSRISGLSLTGGSWTPAEKVANMLVKFFTSPMINLTSLKLRSLEASPASIFSLLSGIKTLVELKLTGSEVIFQHFIGFLESNPNLKAIEFSFEFSEVPSTAPKRLVSLPRLRRLKLTCSEATDARMLLSCLSLPRGVHMEIYGTQKNPCGDLTSFLPFPPTLIRALLAPITAVRYSPGQLYLFSNNGSFSFRSHKTTEKLYEEFNLFATGAVRELRLLHFYSGDNVSLLLKRLPALEALVIQHAVGSGMSALGEEPILCPSLKTLALLDCYVADQEIKTMEEVLAKREHTTAARLHRIVIASRTCSFPAPKLVSRLQKLVPRVEVVVGDKLPNLL